MEQKTSEISQNRYKLKFSQRLYVGLKVIMDFFISLIALIILSPLFLITAFAIIIDSRGHVFFCQERIGKNGKVFKCIKFRSMSKDANHHVAGYEYEGVDAYITRVGRVIRKLSIDELPQLYNILIGQMSLIGYRPSQDNEKELNEAREEYNMYQIRPGLSGWAQVNGRDELASQPKKKAEFDKYYLERISLWLDIKILFMTIGKVFKSDSVKEGVIVEEPATLQEEQIAVQEETNIVQEDANILQEENVSV